MKPNISTPGPEDPLNVQKHDERTPQPCQEGNESKQRAQAVTLKADSEWIVLSDRLREVIHHENELVNHRIHWLVLLNGLAFAATGVLWGKEGVFPILIALGIAGAVCTLSCYLALQGGRLALEATNDFWFETRFKRRAGSVIAPISARPKPGARRARRTEGNSNEFVALIKSLIAWPCSMWNEVVRWKAWKNGAWVDNRITRKLHPLNAIPVVIILVWCVVVANLCWNKFYQRETGTFPVRLTHRGLEIEVKEAEEAAPARVVGEGAKHSVPSPEPQVPVPSSGKNPTVPETGSVAPPPAPDGNKQEPPGPK